MKKLMIMVVAAMATAFAAVADTSFAYQGVLRDELGKPLAAEQATITFRLYDTATDGSALWTKEMNLAIDTNGLFNAELTGNNLDSTIADAQKQGKTLYVGLTVSGSAGEITPRQKMIPTPLASYAQNVAKADKDFTVNGTAYFEGAVSMKSSTAVLNAASVDASGTLDVTGKASLKGGAELQGDVTVGNTLTVNGVYMSLPVGSIIMWAGEATDLPADGCWAICDGQTEYMFNGKKCKVPDLRGRFIVGVGKSSSGTTDYTAGATGGEEKHQLTTDEMPSHTHDISVPWRTVSHYSTEDREVAQGLNNSNPPSDARTWKNCALAKGGDQSHENRPPYYALCYIIKIK